MKRHLLMPLFLFFISSLSLAKTCTDSCDNEATSRTYLAIQPHFQSQSPELLAGFRDERTHAREDGRHGAFQFVLFGSKSTNEKDLARYFFPDGKESLIVDEDINAAEKDLLAQHFNIFTQNENFRSRISIEPQQSVVGFGIHYRQSFKRNEEKGRGFWFSASAPIIRVKNDLNFKENVLDDGGGPNEDADENVVGTMKEAFNQSEWKFGKITDKSMTETKLADIELKIGYEWLEHAPCHMESYFGIIIPTGNRPEGEFVFEPIVGRGKHAGVMFGSSLGIEIWADEDTDKIFRFELSNHSEYLFKKEHIRSFDLKNKPWSRYIEVYENEDQAQEARTIGLRPNLVDVERGANLATPGINVFTQKVDVTPGTVHDINTAFVLSCKGFQGEIGYNFFAKRSECVKLASPWKEGPAIKHRAGQGETNPIRNITGNRFLEQEVRDEAGQVLIPVLITNFNQSIIKENDLDLQSAATPCMLSHTLYGALGYRWDREYPILTNFGGSFTFSRNNNAVIRRWTIWAKLGFSF